MVRDSKENTEKSGEGMGILRQGAVLSSFSDGSVTCFLIIITSFANIWALNHFLNKQKTHSLGCREIWASLRSTWERQYYSLADCMDCNRILFSCAVKCLWGKVMELVQRGRQLKAKTLLKNLRPKQELASQNTIPAGNEMEFFPYSFYFNVGRFCLGRILDIVWNFKCWTCYQMLTRFKCPMTICLWASPCESRYGFPSEICSEPK